ncbi:MAG: hypothetical protein IPJ21_08490 [Sterolibacteriaceae bacterium]|nr:hypothetical protein [Sterolibacteriaceae bacterium]MBK9083906.1 hypothetical protein [Sterolibacteriaceae bacterium]
MDLTTPVADGDSAWNPGLGTGIPVEFQSLETIFRAECVFGRREEIEELANLTGLPREELTVFRPARLALHELIVRVTAEIAVPEGETEEVFGRNVRRIAGKIRSDYVAPRMVAIEEAYADLSRRAEHLVRRILGETLYPPPAPASARPFPLNLLRRPAAAPVSPESIAEREYRVISSYKAAGLAADDRVTRAVYKSLYRVLGAIAGSQGRIGSDQDLLATLVRRHVCNSYGSQVVGQMIAPLVEAAIEQEGYTRIANSASPILISLKGASAAGKSSLRPMVKQIMREQGIDPDSYATISPDIWRRMLIDYGALGAAYKYAGHLTSRELMVVDAKLDRYIRNKANRTQAIPHILVDRFRFDTFSTDQVARVLNETYAKYVDTMYMYFIVTPPEETVVRGWQRALERGRYKAVEDFLGHSVEAYTGMPRILFKWLAYRRPDYRYFFLDNGVPKGTIPKTIAFGSHAEITIYDPAGLINIERYQKIDIHARSREEVYAPAQIMDVASNCGFLRECIRRIRVVNFVDRVSGTTYLQARDGVLDVLDRDRLARMLDQAETAAAIREIAPHLIGS